MIITPTNCNRLASFVIVQPPVWTPSWLKPPFQKTISNTPSIGLFPVLCAEAHRLLTHTALASLGSIVLSLRKRQISVTIQTRSARSSLHCTAQRKNGKLIHFHEILIYLNWKSLHSVAALQVPGFCLEFIRSRRTKKKPLHPDGPDFFSPDSP